MSGDPEGPLQGHERMLMWAQDLGDELVSALEDCRHVSGNLERFLIARGERVVRSHPSSWPAPVASHRGQVRRCP